MASSRSAMIAPSAPVIRTACSVSIPSSFRRGMPDGRWAAIRPMRRRAGVARSAAGTGSAGGIGAEQAGEARAEVAERGTELAQRGLRARAARPGACGRRAPGAARAGSGRGRQARGLGRAEPPQARPVELPRADVSPCRARVTGERPALASAVRRTPSSSSRRSATHSAPTARRSRLSRRRIPPRAAASVASFSTASARRAARRRAAFSAAFSKATAACAARISTSRRSAAVNCPIPSFDSTIAPIARWS